MEIKQHTSEQPEGLKRNQKGNQKIIRDKQKWKHNVPKLMGCIKSILGGNFFVINIKEKVRSKYTA